jgi:hypothetical protein
LETELNLDMDPDPELITDPDPKLQIILDPAISGSTTLLISNLKPSFAAFWEYRVPLREQDISSLQSL